MLHNLIKIHIIIILQWHFIDAIFYVMIDVQLRYPHYRALFWFIQSRFLYQNKQNHNFNHDKRTLKSFSRRVRWKSLILQLIRKNTKFSNVYFHQLNPQRNHFDFHCSALPLLFENHRFNKYFWFEIQL